MSTWPAAAALLLPSLAERLHPWQPAPTRQALRSPKRSLILQPQAMRRWYDEVIAHQDDICTIMTMESGKPSSESKAECLTGCGHLARSGVYAR